ncbi:MAG TPA: thioesterase family protein [bacterium]|nr:thioesterase family protein [bacterium]HMW37049.1 thioesterase family protein [bacterium]HMY34782.1 thioesterase family protein [bacterium]HMZ03882.1 thioesterase family protein [bacterium]HNB08545.1 thioesterase family protein [bacterium]
MMKGIAELSGYPVVYSTPVAWGEMDALGHVNNIMYFRYFESARSDYFQRIGVWDHAREHGVGVILHSTQCRFKRPLTYPDQIHVGATTVEVMADRFRMKYAVWSEAQQAIVAEGEGLIVVYDYNQNQKCPMPSWMREAIAELEKKASQPTNL